ncbi:hypothetical protein [Smaragdicoccus niigatensis]|uniref:hypothetical protein n=1 Tax=Smaragdicoccus niigatensis TaxID=359359 RepID=UPI000369D852|nr:hypothetical protein [Smaragdicoccus niigatensis]
MNIDPSKECQYCNGATCVFDEQYRDSTIRTWKCVAALTDGPDGCREGYFRGDAGLLSEVVERGRHLSGV